MKEYRFKESPDFAGMIISRWKAVVNGELNINLNLMSLQMKNASVYIMTVFNTDNNQIELNLMNGPLNVLYTVTLKDCTERSAAYAADSILGYARDVALVNISEK